jgi:hypothetical protein
MSAMPRISPHRLLRSNRISRVIRTGGPTPERLQFPGAGADDAEVRVPVLVYGVLYVVFEMVRHQLELIGWERVTPLHVASALVDALLAIVIAIGAVVAFDVGRRRWGPALRAWQERQLRMAAEAAQFDQEPIPVTSWRPGQEAEPLAVAAPHPSPAPEPTYAPSTYARSTGRRFTEDPGRQL